MAQSNQYRCEEGTERTQAMIRQYRRRARSGKEFVFGLVFVLGALYSVGPIKRAAEAGHREWKPEACTDLYCSDPYTYGTPVSPVWPLVKRAMDVTRQNKSAARKISATAERPVPLAEYAD